MTIYIEDNNKKKAAQQANGGAVQRLIAKWASAD